MKQRLDSRRLWAIGGLFVTLLVSSILFRNFQAPECTQVVQGPLSTAVLVNCDSAQIVQDSQTPSRLWTSKTSYQDRPLYTLSGYVISKPLRLLVDSSEIYENTRGKPIKFYYANYMAFILINFILLSLILWQTIRLIRSTLPERSFRKIDSILLLISILTLLLANNVVKGFAWTPHTQLFNLLLVIYSMNLWMETETSGRKRILTIHFLVIGILLFFYPMFVLLYVIPLLKHFKSNLLPTVLSIAPYLVYPFILSSAGGIYRNAAVQDFDGFVWVLKATEDPGIIFDKLELFARSFTDLPALYLSLALLGFVALKHRFRLVRFGWRYLGFILAFAGFVFLMGYSGPRLAFPILACLIIYLLFFLVRNGAPKDAVVSQTLVATFSLGFFFLTQGPLT